MAVSETSHDVGLSTQWKGTRSNNRRETSCVSARSETTKYILMSVIARVMHLLETQEVDFRFSAIAL